MKPRIPLFLGIFAIMALSNAIVPVLPAYSADSALQGAVYAAYFLGAFVITLPAGILSDRYGRIPLARAGLFVTLASGILMSITTDPFFMIAARLLEGLGAGIFVSAAMSYTNAEPEHRRESGILMAMLNTGLVTGLFLAGWLDTIFADPSPGLRIFTIISAFSAGLSLLATESPERTLSKESEALFPLVWDNCGIWYSSVILIGITGIASSIYPAYSMLSPAAVGIWIAVMSISTIVAVLLISGASWSPLPAIRWSAVLMAGGIVLTLFSPLGFVVLGSVAGIVIVAQMAALSGMRNQGAIMGLFSTSGYLGMTILPFIAGLIARGAGFPWAFLTAAVLALTVILFIREPVCLPEARKFRRF